MLLRATGLCKSYSAKGKAQTHVLQNVDLECEAGEFIALMGPSGAGKSTLMHILATLDRPDKGEVVLATKGTTYAYSALNNKTLALLRSTEIGIVYQFHHLLPEFTAEENVMMPLLIAGVPQTDARNAASAMLERVGMLNRGSHAPSELSGGEQQRVAIARALVHNPSVLFADEPTGNLDSDNAEAVASLIVELQTERKMTCVVATHSHDLAVHAHRIVQLRDGHVVA
ncbi:MAG: ABC transporter ATP-binding protein [Bradyrhizobiaceae bacterium]|nr:ABC transporter ATP-binding protein [Bradyrhizobiaceae bacterium]